MEVIAAPQFLLEEVILLAGERARETALLSGNIVRDEQMSQGWELLCPGEFFQHAAQVDRVPGATMGRQGRVARSEQRQPAEEMWITPELGKGANRRILSAKIIEKLPDGYTVTADGRLAE